MTNRKTTYATTIMLALLAGFAGAALSRGTLPAAEPTVAARANTDPPQQQWEYCAVLKAQFPGSLRGEVYWISYFKGERMETVTVEAPPSGNAFSKAVNKLGNEGWEMVGQGPLEVRTGPPGPATTAVFFKRRKEDK